mmetsp:Transcript_2390/g.5502  ORF Transcript_2390/g.5502 Transcript_2390/m.5502 type:complete len:278 (+) Transcript_2390:629-1462(+)
MSKARLANPPRFKCRVPCLQALLKGAVHAGKVIIVVTRSTVTRNEQVAQNVFNGGRSGVILDALGVRVKAHGEEAIVLRLEVIIQRRPVTRLAGIVAPLRPSLASTLHEGVLLRRPDAEALVLEELFHPVVVRDMLEETEEGEVGVVEVTVHLGASGVSALGVLAGSGIPRLVVTVPVLVFSYTPSFVFQIDVRSPDQVALTTLAGTTIPAAIIVVVVAVAVNDETEIPPSLLVFVVVGLSVHEGLDAVGVGKLRAELAVKVRGQTRYVVTHEPLGG